MTSHYFSDLQIFKISPACFALKEFRCKNAGLFTSWSQNLSLFDNLKLLVVGVVVGSKVVGDDVVFSSLVVLLVVVMAD